MLRARLLETFGRHGDCPALWVGGQLFSYRELQDAALSVQTALDRIPNAQVVGILAERTLTAYAAVLAAIFTSRTYLPLNPSYPQNRLLNVLDRARPGAVVADFQRASAAKQLVEHASNPCSLVVPDAENTTEASYRLAGHGALLKVADDGTATAAGSTHPGESVPPVYLMFTSGTTGEPKGIAISGANVIPYLRAIEQLFDFRPSDRFSQFFSLSFDLSVHDMLVAWTHGACLYVPSGLELIDPVRFSQRHELSVWFSVPSMAALAIRARKLRPGALPALRHALFCGESLSRHVAERFASAAPNAQITNLYGPTEGTIAITGYRLARETFAEECPEVVPIGHPFPGQECLVLDEHHVAVPVGEVGELWLAGSQVAAGYFNDSQQTATKFRHFEHPKRAGTCWYATGDLVAEHRIAGLLYRGRKDDQIKLHGHRIEITEVEEALRQAAATALAVIVPWSSEPTQAPEKLIAVVCPPHRPATEILEEMRRRLPPFMVPSRIISVPKLEFNTNHKLDRKRIAECAWQLNA